MRQYTSSKFSKKLWENGCVLKPITFFLTYQSYDILWEICIEFAKEFFGDYYADFYDKNGYFWSEKRYEFHSKNIFDMLQENATLKDIEKYIWDNCLFNPKIQKKEKINEKITIDFDEF